LDVAVGDRVVQRLDLGDHARERLAQVDVEGAEERPHLPCEPLELERHAGQAGRLDECRLVGEVGLGGFVVGAQQTLEFALQRLGRDRVLEHQLLQRERPERGAQGVDLEHVERAQFGHEGAAVGDQPDEPVAFEQAQRVADRRARETELLGERELLDAIAGPEGAVDDGVADRLQGEVDVRRRRAPLRQCGTRA